MTNTKKKPSTSNKVEQLKKQLFNLKRDLDRTIATIVEMEEDGIFAGHVHGLDKFTETADSSHFELPDHIKIEETTK